MKKFSLKALNRIINNDNIDIDKRYKKASKYVCYNNDLNNDDKKQLCSSLIKWYKLVRIDEETYYEII